VSLTAFLQKVVAVLDEAGVPHMLTGSLAAAYYAVPRATQDVDVVIETQEDGIGRIVEGLLAAGWYVDRDAALEAWRHRGQFNTIEPESGWKADFIVRRDRAYSREEFSRRRSISLLGVHLTVASVEDVLIAKMEWSQRGDSALQRRDVAQLASRTWSQLDRPYLERWVVELGLQGEWAAAVASLDEAGDDGDT